MTDAHTHTTAEEIEIWPNVLVGWFENYYYFMRLFAYEKFIVHRVFGLIFLY